MHDAGMAMATIFFSVELGPTLKFHSEMETTAVISLNLYRIIYIRILSSVSIKILRVVSLSKGRREGDPYHAIMSEQAVDASGLSLQQLAEVRKQLEAEVDHLSESSVEIRRVLAKFMDCSQSVKQVSTQAQDGAEIMVPITQSLYVPGRMENTGKFLVDVGTNYYVEKTGDDTVKFFDNKVGTLSKNLVDIDKLLKEKASMLRGLDAVYKEKFQAELKQAKPEST